MSEKLLQNTLAEATTEQGFPTKVGVPVQREVELEDGTVVTVESVTPDKMATILKSTFITPGEKYQDNGLDLNGVVQNYNEEDEPTPEPESSIEIGHTYNFILKNDIVRPEITLDKAYHIYTDNFRITTEPDSIVSFCPAETEISEWVTYYTEKPTFQTIQQEIVDANWDGIGWYYIFMEGEEFYKYNETQLSNQAIVSITDTRDNPTDLPDEAMTILSAYFDIEEVTE